MEPITLEQAKLHLGVTSLDQDILIEGQIAAARDLVEKRTDLVLTRRAVTETLSGLCGPLRLKTWPIASVDGVAYVDAAGALQPIAAASWYALVQRRPVSVMPVASNWSVQGAQMAIVTMTAGFASPDDVPAAIRAAMLLIIGNLFENREETMVGLTSSLPMGVDALLSPYLYFG